MKMKIEFVYDPLNDETLVLVWEGMHIVHKGTFSGAFNKEEEVKLTKKLKKEFKNVK